MSEATEEDKQADSPAIKIGGELRNAREAKSMTVEEVARRLNLEPHVVDKLEHNDYEFLPEPAYIRGYLLAYIRLMDLPIALLKSFDEVNSANQPLLHGSRPAKSSCGQDGWSRCIGIGLVVVLIVGLALWVIEQPFYLLEPEQTVVEQDSGTAPAMEETAPVGVPVMPDGPDEAAAMMDMDTSSEMEPAEISQAEAAGPEMVEQNKPIEAETTGEADVAAMIQEVVKPVLTMKFSDDTWIRVDDADGNRLEAGTFRNGQEISVAHDGELHLIIGRTQNVELSYAGEAVDLSRFKSGGVARLVLGRPAEQ
ncbi:MAG: DUF4115 domain-containing protein [Gammaproteobacteria bacterium]|nr:DUF4115 domain-containing protein [Gammaproteobacteria bacterium]